MIIFPAISYQLTAFAAEGGGGIAVLGVDLKSLILQIVSFVLLYWLLKKFAFAKIISALDERRRTIDQGVELGLKLAEEKDRLDTQVEKLLNKARLEADNIIVAGRQDVSAMLKEAETAASKKTDAMLADAQARIEDDILRARRKLEQETLALVAEATEVIIGEKLDAQKDSALIERALKVAKS